MGKKPAKQPRPWRLFFDGGGPKDGAIEESPTFVPAYHVELIDGPFVGYQTYEVAEINQQLMWVFLTYVGERWGPRLLAAGE